MEPRIMEQIEGIVESSGSSSAHIKVPEAWIGEKVKVTVVSEDVVTAEAVQRATERHRAREKRYQMEIRVGELKARIDGLNEVHKTMIHDLEEQIERLHLDATSR